MAGFSFRHPLRSIIEAIFSDDRPERPRPETPEPIDYGERDFNPSEVLDDPREQAIWESITREDADTNFANTYWEIYQDTGAWIDENKRTADQYWEDFLRAFYLTTGDEGHMTRAEWYAMTGVDKSSIDWQAWREVKHSP